MSYKKIKTCDVCNSEIKGGLFLKIELSGKLPCSNKNMESIIDRSYNHVCCDCVDELSKVLIFSKEIGQKQRYI